MPRPDVFNPAFRGWFCAGIPSALYERCRCQAGDVPPGTRGTKGARVLTEQHWLNGLHCQW